MKTRLAFHHNQQQQQQQRQQQSCLVQQRLEEMRSAAATSTLDEHASAAAAAAAKAAPTAAAVSDNSSVMLAEYGGSNLMDGCETATASQLLRSLSRALSGSIDSTSPTSAQLHQAAAAAAVPATVATAAAAAASITPASLPIVLQRLEQGAGTPYSAILEPLDNPADTLMAAAAAVPGCSAHLHKRSHTDMSPSPRLRPLTVPGFASAVSAFNSQAGQHLSQLPSGWTAGNGNSSSSSGSGSHHGGGTAGFGLQGSGGFEPAGFISSDCQKLLQRLLMPPPPKRPKCSVGIRTGSSTVATAAVQGAAAGTAGDGSTDRASGRGGLGRSTSFPCGVCIEGGSRTLLMSE
jgi:hypothetical protein